METKSALDRKPQRARREKTSFVGIDACIPQGLSLNLGAGYTFTIEPHLLPRSRSDPSVAGGLFVKYDVQEQLGKGSFAVVHKAIDKDTGAIVAIKIINKLRFTKDKKSRQMLKRE